MNTETENNDGSNAKLQGAFGDRGTNVNAGMAYGHPYAEKIIEEAKEIIRQSETGQSLLRAQNHHNIPIHVIKGNGPSGFNPQARVIYVQIGGKVTTAEPKAILDLIRGLREADQDLIGFKAPDPAKDIMEYATVMHSKALDAIVYICKVLKELTNSSSFPVLLDEMEKIGHINVYNAFVKDATEEELFDAYAGLTKRG